MWVARADANTFKFYVTERREGQLFKAICGRPRTNALTSNHTWETTASLN